MPLLAGSFRLVTVTTSHGQAYRQVDASVFTLRLADSLERATARKHRIGYAPRRDLQLIGTWSSAPGSAEGRSASAEMDAGLLLLGCRDCSDGSPLNLRVTAVDSSGFWGTWHDYQTGIGRVVDESGRPLPDPAGFFCATRESAP